MKESIETDEILFLKIFVMDDMAFELSENMVPRIAEEDRPHQRAASNRFNSFLNRVQKFASEGCLNIQVYCVSFDVLPEERMEFDFGSHPQA